MKRMVFSFSFLLFVSGINAQITLEECQRKTQENYPLVHQYGLVEKTKEYNLENAAKGYLPQFALSAKASYQSEVTEIPVKLPGVDLKGLPKDQYQVMLELQQKIWDGGGIRTQKKQTTAEAEIEKEKLNVDMYALNSRVNDLYFGILLLDEQLKQNALLQDELERNYRQITAYVENGIANQADLDAVKVEQLNTKQKRVELVSSRMAYLKMLSLLVGEKLSQETVLEKPVPQDEISAVSEIRRPELSLFNAQGVGLQVQEKALNVRHLPQFGLFVQGAYGNPGLNMLKNEFSPYYIAGVRLSWNFGSLYTLKNDRKVIENKRRQLDNNRDVFLFNTRLEMTQQDQAIQSLEKQMQDDDEIIRLRVNIRKAAEAKVENGTLTVMNGSVALVPGANTVEENSELTITATPNKGYNLASLTVNGEDITSGETHTVTGATEISVTFEAKPTHTVTYSVVEGEGSIILTSADGTQSYESGEPIEAGTSFKITFDPAEDYKVGRVMYGPSQFGAIMELTLASDNSYTMPAEQFVGNYTFEAYFVYDPETGIAENDREAISARYVSGVLHVEGVTDGEFEVNIYNLTGKLVRTATETTVDVADLAKGCYLVKVTTAEAEKVVKIIKK